MHCTCQYRTQWQQKIENHLTRDDKTFGSTHRAVLCPSCTVDFTSEEDATQEQSWLLTVALGRVGEVWGETGHPSTLQHPVHPSCCLHGPGPLQKQRGPLALVGIQLFKA